MLESARKINPDSFSDLKRLKIEAPQRADVEYTDQSKRFFEMAKDFSKQYAHIYSARLRQMRALLLERVKNKWGVKHPVKQLFELREGNEEKCVVIGTLFIHQQLKPSILKELSDELDIVPQPVRTKYVHENDKLILEDELQRIRLVGDVIDVHQVVTGVVCAVLGYEEGDGAFKMLDVCWAECGPQSPLPTLTEDRYLVLMSGLDLGSTAADHYLSLRLMVEWITGLSGGQSFQEESAKIVKTIIAGGSVRSSAANKDTINGHNGLGPRNLSNSKIQNNDLGKGGVMGDVDSFCAALSNSVFVDLMPGVHDPTGVMLPQMPLHYCHSVLGSSGEPVLDIMRYSDVDDPLTALELTLKWRHIAPTAPDTLSCTPCQEKDPFIIEKCPSVYFTGCMEEFQTKLFEGDAGQKVRLVCVPKFVTTRSVVVVNLRTLDCHPVSFKISSNSDA